MQSEQISNRYLLTCDGRVFDLFRRVWLKERRGKVSLRIRGRYTDRSIAKMVVDKFLRPRQGFRPVKINESGPWSADNIVLMRTEHKRQPRPRKFTKTDEAVALYCDGLSVAGAAFEVGIDEAKLRHAIRRRAERGTAPEFDPDTDRAKKFSRSFVCYAGG